MSDSFKRKLVALLGDAETVESREKEVRRKQQEEQVARRDKELRIMREVWRPILEEAVEILQQRGWTASVIDAKASSEHGPGLHLQLGTGGYAVTYYPRWRELRGPHGKASGGLPPSEDREKFEAEVLEAIKQLTATALAPEEVRGARTASGTLKK